MKAKRTFIVLAIVVAVLALGIAYAAALTNTLSISGTASATADANNFNVEFSGVSAVTGDNATGSTASAEVSGNKKMGSFTFTGFTAKDQVQEATWTISNVNTSNLKATVNMSVSQGAESEYFRATIDKSTVEIAPNGTAQVKVTVTCIKTPVDGTVSSGDITIGLTATASDAGNV